MSHCNRDYRDLQNRQQNFPDFPISCSCRNIQFSFNSQSMYVYTWKTISALIHGILQRLIQKKIAIIPSTQSKRINRQNRKRTLLIEWRTHFRTFIFMEHIWNIKGKNKKPIWVTLPAENEGEKRERNHQFEIDTLVLSEYANLICNDTVPSVSIPEPHPCTPDDRVLVLQWWSRCVHTQFVQFCMNKVYTNATLQYEG